MTHRLMTTSTVPSLRRRVLDGTLSEAHIQALIGPGTPGLYRLPLSGEDTGPRRPWSSTRTASAIASPGHAAGWMTGTVVPGATPHPVVVGGIGSPMQTSSRYNDRARGLPADACRGFSLATRT